jgi:hypothetical protein
MQHHLPAALVFEAQQRRIAHLRDIPHLVAIRETRAAMTLAERFDGFVTRFRPTPNAAPVACAC